MNKASQNAVIQQQLDDAYTGPKFKLASYIAEVLVLIMVAIVYGAAMPLLYFIAALGCWITIRLDKRLLLRQEPFPAAYH